MVFHSGQVESVNAIQAERSFGDDALPRARFHALRAFVQSPLASKSFPVLKKRLVRGLSNLCYQMMNFVNAFLISFASKVKECRKISDLHIVFLQYSMIVKVNE
jgi:hypothetical protein